MFPVNIIGPAQSPNRTVQEQLQSTVLGNYIIDEFRSAVKEASWGSGSSCVATWLRKNTGFKFYG